MAIAIAGFVAIWGYVLYLSFGPGRADPVDRLDDRRFPEAAEPICAATRATIDELPLAPEMATPADRGRLIDAATVELEDMVTALHALERPRGDEGDVVARWLADWEQYNRDRRAYADRFAQGLDEPARVTDRGGFHIDRLIEEFAIANDMDSCAPPPDV